MFALSNYVINMSLPTSSIFNHWAKVLLFPTHLPQCGGVPCFVSNGRALLNKIDGFIAIFIHRDSSRRKMENYIVGEGRKKESAESKSGVGSGRYPECRVLNGSRIMPLGSGVSCF